LLLLVDDEAENSCLKTGNIIAPAAFLDINWKLLWCFDHIGLFWWPYLRTWIRVCGDTQSSYQVFLLSWICPRSMWSYSVSYI
jgi:hypothetical protein